LRTLVPGRLNHYRVDSRVNSVRNNGPELIEQVGSVHD
jgi:putative SOS response-associated peptidase YedK